VVKVNPNIFWILRAAYNDVAMTYNDAATCKSELANGLEFDT